MPGLPQSAWATTPAPVLPLHIFSRIIDLSADSVRALQLYSLICRSWLPRCRSHIFSSLSFNNQTSFNQFRELVRTNPLLASFARKLQVRYSVSLRDDDPQWPTLVPLLLGTLLGALRELEFACPLIYPHQSFYTSVTHLKEVNSLSISGPIILTFSDFVRLLVSFPSLTHLRVNLDGISGWKKAPSPAKRFVSRLRLTVLEVRDIDGHLQELINWLLKTPTAASLRTIWFEFRDVEEFESIGRLVSSCGSLEKLTLDLTLGGVLSPREASKQQLQASNFLVLIFKFYRLSFISE